MTSVCSCFAAWDFVLNTESNQCIFNQLISRHIYKVESCIKRLHLKRQIQICHYPMMMLSFSITNRPSLGAPIEIHWLVSPQHPRLF